MTGGESGALEPLRPPSPARRWLPLVLTVGLVVVAYRALGGRLEDVLELDRGFADPQTGPLALASALLLIAYGLAARMWGWMLRDVGGTDPGTRASIQLLLAANLGRYVPGKIWQLAGLAVLARRRGLPAVAAAGSSLLVQGFTLVATLVWALPILPFGIGDALRGVTDVPGAAGGGAAGAGAAGGATSALVPLMGVLVGGLILASLPPVTHRGIRLLYRLGRQPVAEAPTPGWSFGTRWLGKNLVLWGIYGLAFALFVHGLGFAVAILPTMAAFAASYLLGNLVVAAPAGLGVREVALASLLLPALGAAAMPVAILARLWMTVLEVVPAVVFAWLELRGYHG
jgi:uncharacterized membrane protein YbhN (UPF0104 family)